MLEMKVTIEHGTQKQAFTCRDGTPVYHLLDIFCNYYQLGDIYNYVPSIMDGNGYKSQVVHPSDNMRKIGAKDGSVILLVAV